jgi:hypothetical protein
MNPQLMSDLATGTVRGFQRTADQQRKHAEGRASTAVTGRHHPSPLRRRIGFTLVEAGLALLGGTADRSAHAGGWPRLSSRWAGR